MSRINWKHAQVYSVEVRSNLIGYGLCYDETKEVMNIIDVIEEIRKNGKEEAVDPAMLALAIIAGENLRMLLKF